MDIHPVDIPAEQIVRWLIDDYPSSRHELRISATRSYIVSRITEAQERRRRLGDEEMEDLSEITAVGVLEVAPLHAHDGWILRVEVEDELSDRLPEDEDAPDEPEEIDLAAFARLFTERDTGLAFVSVEAENAQAWARCAVLLKDIENDRHDV